MTYADFLAQKVVRTNEIGPEVAPEAIHPHLHDWQGEIVRWAARTGRAAIWADTGLGKTVMQVEWLKHVSAGGCGLIVAPLAVCHQTVREAATVGVAATYVRHASEMEAPGVYVTNYEMVEQFDPAEFRAVVLDEASILKQSDGKTRTMLIQHFADVPFRLTCTATPAPNDPEELTNQAEFLGHQSRVHMLAAYFIHDDQGWRLKGHARTPMYRWMSSWAVALRRPSDLGYSDDGYQLPGLEIVPELVDVAIEPEDGNLFGVKLGGVNGRSKMRKLTLSARCERAAELVNESHGLAADGTKLAAWDGSLSTPPTAAPSTPTTRSSVNDGKLREEPQSATASTCAVTTPPTRSVSSSTSETTKSGAMPAAASATPVTPSTEPSACESPSCATLPLSVTADCAGSSASLRPSTTSACGCKTTAVQSVRHPSGTPLADALPSTIATTPAECGESSAGNATSDSASSEMTPHCSPEPSSTSRTDLEPWIIWCGLNAEQEHLARVFGDRCISLTGSQTPEQKVDLLYRWLGGERPILLTKTSIAGQGINMQHCARMAFVGLSDSYEAYYQAIRRCYRYGQTRVVRAHVILSSVERQIASNIARKERDAGGITTALVAEMRRAREDRP